MSAAVSAVLAKVGDAGARRSGDTWLVKCPGHEDGRRSLAIKQGDRGAMLTCHAGCETAHVVEVLGMKMADLFDGPPVSRGGGRIVREYDYRDETGALLYQVVRMEPKDFRQRAPDGRGWSWKLEGVRRVLYRLPELIASAPRAVFVVEGEKDADALAAMGLVATTNAGGAGKWRADYSAALRGRPVFILPDNDEPGYAHAEVVSRALTPIAQSVRVVSLPGVPPKGDVSDWIAAGGTKEALLELAKAPGDERTAIRASVARLAQELAQLQTLLGGAS